MAEGDDGRPSDEGLILILSGGLSRRMGRPKALLRVRADRDAPTFLELITERTSGLGGLRGVVTSLAPELLESTLPTVVQRRPEEGQLSSLLLGWKTWGEGANWLMVCLVDHPFVEESTYRELLEARRVDPDALVWSLSYGKRGGHPVLFSREFVELLSCGPLEGGPRPLLREHSARRRWVDTDDPAVRWDVDTPEQYERYLALHLHRGTSHSPT